MTKAQFIDARRSLQRQLSWRVVPWAAVWFAAVIGMAAGFRDWFNRRPNVTLLVLGAEIVIFLVPVIFISRRLHERHGLVCPRCGEKMFLGRYCVRCWSAIVDEE